MDKKNFTIGVALLLAAFAVLYLSPKSPPPTVPANAQPATGSAPATATAAAGTAPEGTAQAGTATTAAPAPVMTGNYAPLYQDPAEVRFITLENDFIRASFTPWGGAIRNVEFKQHPAVQGKPEPYTFNRLAEEPILAIDNYPGLGRDTRYEVVASSSNTVTFKTTLNGKIEVTRVYQLMAAATPGADPYRVRHETTFRNVTTGPETIPNSALNIGTATLINAADNGIHLNVVTFNDDKVRYVERSELDGGGIGSVIGQGRVSQRELVVEGPTVWAAAKNQFFASIYTPDTPAKGVLVRRIDLTPVAPFLDSANVPDPRHPNVGIIGAVRFDGSQLAPEQSAKISGSLYVGPQEYKRLAKLDHNEHKVLPYTQYFFNRIFFSGYVAPFLNLLLNWVHSWSGNWGIAVVIMTLILKIVSLPFTLAASKSAKRMAKLQPLMQELREKYKDNPQKQQQATMELFKTHKVNPVGGCIPILITFPLFVGFFAMLQGTAELRFQPFLWAHDLSAPDVVARIYGFPLNIMPLLMGATMFFQMKLTPTPSVDNMQVKMMKFMPIIFTAICYNFSCALSLYSTINGLFTIGQQMVINRMKDDPGSVGPGTAAATTISSWKKTPKNVTPKKK